MPQWRKQFAGEGLDGDGYIVDLASLDKIPAYASPILDDIRENLLAVFSGSLHSIYLYGSMATGAAKPPGSDIDLIVVFKDEADLAEKEALALLGKILSSKYSGEVREVGLESHSLPKALDPADLYGWGCFLKHLTVCFWGDDLRVDLPRFRPSVEISRAFNGDYPVEIEKLKANLIASTNIAVTETYGRRIARKTIRTCFSLVMPRAKCWITDLNRSAEIFLSFYPEHARTMSLLQNWSATPPESSKDILPLLDNFTPWLRLSSKDKFPNRPAHRHPAKPAVAPSTASVMLLRRLP